MRNMALLLFLGTTLFSFLAAPAVSAQEDILFKEVMELGLPVVKIETVNREWPDCDSAEAPAGCMGHGITNTNKVKGCVTVYLPDSTILFTSGMYNGQDSGMTIKVRGNDPTPGKRPYKIKLVKKGDMLGRGDSKYKDKNWVLLKDELQKTCNGFEINRLLNRGWTPAYITVNVIMNGEYQGHYLLAENIERNTDCRLDVANTGFIVELDPYWWNENGEYMLSRWDKGYNYTFKYPDFEDLTDERTEYIQTCLNAFQDALFTPDYPLYIDVNSFAGWLLGHDILGSYDAGGANKYFMKYDNTEESLIAMGPLWDFNATETRMGEWSNVHTHLDFFGAMLVSSNVTFVQAYLDMWDEKKAEILEGIKLFLETQADAEHAVPFNASADMNARKWGGVSYHAERNTSRALEWYIGRFEALETLMQQLRKYVGVQKKESYTGGLKVRVRNRQITLCGTDNPAKHVYVYDITGRCLYSGAGLLSIPPLPSAGLYIVKAETAEGNVVCKIAVQ